MIGEAARNPAELTIPPVNSIADQAKLTPPPSPKVGLGHQRMPEHVGSKTAGVIGNGAQGRSASWSHSSADNSLMAPSFTESSPSASAFVSPAHTDDTRQPTTYKPPVELTFGNAHGEFSWGSPLSATPFSAKDDISSYHSANPFISDVSPSTVLHNPFASPKTGGSNNDGFGAFIGSNRIGGTNAGISFGSIDGTITAGADAWTNTDADLGMPSSSKKNPTSASPALGFGMNPWS
jgi:hypothetical protein